ncbi:hypothetical protein D9Q98_005611 [Chlorella vulgaris]|uniref:Protein kinase domain-containing protein n=1 Tax=Chlorella vulgaris TaxID=3077 RepID=A0A9D4TMC7_CHLVU|nr:hypothetical protein D9Q98_005611 [Chlorella vulgaris]
MPVVEAVAAPAAADDLPVLPSNFFNDPRYTGYWNFHNDFTEVREIGKGKDTLIFAAMCPKLGRRVAVKQYDKSKIQNNKYRAIKREIAMMMFFQRKRLPSVVDYYGAFHDEKHVYIVMEHCGGGDLLEKLLRTKRGMSERTVALEVALPCLAVLQCLHELRIIHRDIKLENIFIDDHGRVKLGDFGLTMSMRQESAISPVGTVEYMAPEVVALPSVDLVASGQILPGNIPPTNEKVDIWALGVTIYELVTGQLPFAGKDKPEIKRSITSNNLSPLPPFLSQQCQSFIHAMLTYNVQERPSCATLLQHPFIAMHCTPLPPPPPKPAPLPSIVTLHAYTPGAEPAVAPGAQPMEVDGCGSRQGGGPGTGGVSSSGSVLAGSPVSGFATPRIAGGSQAPVTVVRDAAVSSAQHSPTILAAQGGLTQRPDPFASPLRPQHDQLAAVDNSSGPVPRKVSFEPFSGGSGKGPGGGEQAALVHSSTGFGSAPLMGAVMESPGLASERPRTANMTVGMKTAWRKLFTRRSQHQRLEEAGQRNGRLGSTNVT